LSYIREFTDPSSTALLMWDFQVGLGGRARHLDAILAANRRLLDAADAAKIPAIWSRHTLPPIADTTPGMQLFQARKQRVATAAELTPFMQPGSPEREFLADLSPRPHDTVIEKSSPSFFVGTPLQQRLFAAGTRSVAITGVATEIGVDLTAKHALALGYVPVVIEDAVGSYTDEKQEIGLAALRTWIPVVTSEEIISVWQEGTTP
jgi:nicotinamidase-related amidase